MQERIRLESEAVTLILGRVEHGVVEWVGSNVLEYEVERIPDAAHRKRLLSLLQFARGRIAARDETAERAESLQQLGFKAMDALHIACAEAAACEILLTTDDRMIRTAGRHAGALRVRVVNPVDWIREEPQP